jgi:hypothetical protein
MGNHFVAVIIAMDAVQFAPYSGLWPNDEQTRNSDWCLGNFRVADNSST